MSDSPQPEDPSDEPSSLTTPEALLQLAAAEFVLVGIGYAIRLIFPIEEPPFRLLTWRGYSDGIGSGIGIAVGLLLFLGYLGTERFSWKSLETIRNYLRNLLRDALVNSSLSHLICVGLAAGVCEEYLFRGVLEPRIGFWLSNAIFAILHFYSPLYLVVAFLVGSAMSLAVTSTDSLWAAISAHAIYDIALLWRMTLNYRSERELA